MKNLNAIIKDIVNENGFKDHEILPTINKNIHFILEKKDKKKLDIKHKKKYNEKGYNIDQPRS